jgi:hypothetical protein
MQLKLAFLSLTLFGCAGKVHIQIMEPAEISVRADITQLALVDRQAGQGSPKVMGSLQSGLAEAPRFDVVDRAASQASLTRQATQVGSPLSKSAARAICKETRSNGIASLERLTMGDDWSVSEREEELTETVTRTRTIKGKEIEREVEITRTVTMHEATFTVNLDSAWTLYECDGTVLDEHPIGRASTWSGEGESQRQAKDATGQPRELRADALQELGLRYRSHISAYNRLKERYYHRWGSTDIRAAHRHVQAGEWNKALEFWTRTARAGSKKVQAKAWHNMALYYEQAGDVPKALECAQKGFPLQERKWGKDYPGRLRHRLRDEKKIEAQLH